MADHELSDEGAHQLVPRQPAFALLCHMQRLSAETEPDWEGISLAAVSLLRCRQQPWNRRCGITRTISQRGAPMASGSWNGATLAAS